MRLVRLLGIDRSETPTELLRSDAPWKPWTIPNAIDYLRLALIPVFLLLAFRSLDTSVVILFLIIAGTDYLDGLAARITGQFSRLGALLDPLVDRLLVASTALICYHYALLPRWALLLLAAREIGMLLLSAWVIRKGRDVQVTMLGRLAVWPIMLALFGGLMKIEEAKWLLFIGLAMTFAASIQYFNYQRRLSRRTVSANRQSEDQTNR